MTTTNTNTPPSLPSPDDDAGGATTTGAARRLSVIFLRLATMTSFAIGAAATVVVLPLALPPPFPLKAVKDGEDSTNTMMVVIDGGDGKR